MATIVLSAVGFAAGSAINSTVFGLSTAIIGRAIGATIGQVIDQRIMGRGSEVVETGQVDRFRLTSASEGTPVQTLYGRVRVPGQVIWATRFQEHVTTTEGSGGKGAPRPATPTTREYSYSISLAVALCEGEISGVNRIWADGQLIENTSVTMRVYHGTEDQMPDPKIEAVEGSGLVPAYRGLAYVVIEDLDLTRFGNRIPQLTFEVTRPAPVDLPGVADDVAEAVQGVALIPGTGEYSLATTPVHYHAGFGENRPANVNSASGKTDLLASLDGLASELPNCGATVLVASWFGDDLRCETCDLKPKVEHKLEEGAGMPWFVSGLNRTTAEEVPRDEDRPVYGGTPTDRSVIEAISALKAAGQAVTFYPFILMEQLAGNGLPDPYSDAPDQPVLPWRGRITTGKAPGQAGSTDGTAAADAEVAAFFGSAAVADFANHAEGIGYTGPAEWSYRRFILHYAHLCAKAGGVEAFCIGSEMRALTQIRGATGFPAVEAMIALAADVRAILGPETKIGYAADWSEYFGYHPQDGSGDVYFHLDPLWADDEIDFIGIDNYMPLSDWRDGREHADAAHGAIYNLDYLRANVAGGEGYDWYYPSEGSRSVQDRHPIEDGAHGEDWVFRYKDLRGWWENTHHNRIAGVRQTDPTGWQPQSKPIWFTEYGCAAIDKGTNQPNKFLDPKSSESQLPHYSNGRRDDVIQAQYLRAMNSYWGAAENNPSSILYGGPMVDMSRAHVWAWDARPYPYFPGNDGLWTDAENYLQGHWLNGRGSARSLPVLVAEICVAAGVDAYDVSELYGIVRGFMPSNTGTARERLQPLMLAYGFDAIEREGQLVFRSRDGRAVADVDPERVAVSPEADGDLVLSRAPEAEIAGRLRLSFVEADGAFDARAEEAIFPDEAATSVARSDLPLVLTKREARAIVERWLSESRVARDVAHFALPPSEMAIRAGDVVALPLDGGPTHYRVDRVEQAEFQMLEAVRVEPETYDFSDSVEAVVRPRPFVAPVPVEPVFLDLPLLTGQEVEHAPHIAATARPWPGTVAVYSAAQDNGYELNQLLAGAAVIGVTETQMGAAKSGVLDRGAGLRVRLVYGDLASVPQEALLNGANAAAIGDGSADNWEVFQFRDAALVGPRTYELTARLRGQAGTDGLMPEFWPVGSVFVLLTPALQQIELAQSARGLARHYRIGPAQRPLEDPSYQHRVEAFDGVGLRPFAPAHLRATPDGSGGVTLGWVRRTRIDGDSWQSVEVPLGEGRELYAVRVLDGATLLREAEVTAPNFTYTAAEKAADGVTGAYQIAVAQVSDRFGPGPFRRIEIDG
ncbi:Gene Transfer Agent host specificity protein [Candidatus Rhodobacter oscarellae]|uniref:Gene Transfer Agent host specificity protein n=1 Tax=Candidatus Rhodobacter oscarellae TaxID=1675527 RepID=A0A0J9E415_9RHOB|nr:glycoside hydrolase/phage tail family protein [Candidatus Rhodobacter lobularis]KMW56589.1 Gene Transfer Agent host specificity protein [Candidatus Rhodobacter lobularis]